MFRPALLLLLLLPGLPASPGLPALLAGQVRAAQCRARCGTDPACLTICPAILVRPASSSLCRFPALCPASCQAACRPAPGPGPVLLSVRQEDCLLSWQLAGQGQVVVAGRDQGGMWNLLHTAPGSNLPLSAQMTTKYLEMAVLAVGGSGVSDQQTVLIQPATECGKVETREEMLESSFMSWPSFYTASLALVAATCLVVVGLLLLTRRDTPASRGSRHCIATTLKPVQSVENKAFISCSDDYEFGDISSNGNVYQFF